MYKAFKITLGIIAALVLVAVLIVGGVTIADYASRPSTADIAKREAAQVAYDKRQASEEDQAKAEGAQQRAEERAEEAQQRRERIAIYNAEHSK